MRRDRYICPAPFLLSPPISFRAGEEEEQKASGSEKAKLLTSDSSCELAYLLRVSKLGLCPQLVFSRSKASCKPIGYDILYLNTVEQTFAVKTGALQAKSTNH